MKHKTLFISLTAIFTALLFIGIFIGVWFLGDTYPDFKDAKQEFEIPGLDESAVPQGISSCYANYSVTEIEKQTEKDENGNPKKDENGNDITKDVEVTKTKMQAYFFISAYMQDGSPSRIYVVGEDTGYVGYVTLKDESGNPFTGHVGGIAINNYTNQTGTAYSNKEYSKYFTLWITSDRYVYVAKSNADYAAKCKGIAQEIVEKAARIKLDIPPELDAEGNPIEKEYDFSIKFTKSFNANCRASFCYYYDDPKYSGSWSNITYDRLYIGEFYNGDKYQTDSSHKVTTNAGYKNTAFVYEFNVSYSTEFGLTTISTSTDSDPVKSEDTVPKIIKIFSLPEKIQGMAFSGRDSSGKSNGTLVLSQSYGLANSKLLCFDYKKVVDNKNRKLFTDLNEKVSFKYEGVKRTSGTDYTDPQLYVYYLDKNNPEMFINELSIPSMSEGMCNLTPLNLNSGDENGRTKFYVLFESASKKYSLFVREKLSQVYSFRFPRLDDKS